MGEFTYPMTIIGPSGQVTLDALVERGATFNWIPTHVLSRLGIEPVRRERFSLADGREIEYEMGFATARIDGKDAPTLCVFGDMDSQPLIGSFTLEGLLLMVDPVGKQLLPRVGSLKEAGNA